MEGLSTITYKNKTILYIDYSKVLGSKQRIIQLALEISEEYQRYPPRSVLALINVENIKYDKDIVNIVSKEQNKTLSFIKKIAVIGMDNLIKVAYDYITGFSQKKIVHVFDSEIEAKEWLVKD
jgi:hypothetical protein